MRTWASASPFTAARQRWPKRGPHQRHHHGDCRRLSNNHKLSSRPRSGVRIDWATDDRAAIQVAIDAAMAPDKMASDGLAREVAFDPNVSTWWAGGPLVIGTSAAPASPVTLRGGSTAGGEIGGDYLKTRSLMGMTTIQKADSKSGHDIIQDHGNGLTRERLCMDGRLAVGHLLNVSFSFEPRVKECKFIRCYTTAVKLHTGNNGQWDDVHVNYCGNGRTWPAVKITSTRNGDGSMSPSNTFHYNNVHLEYNSGLTWILPAAPPTTSMQSSTSSATCTLKPPSPPYITGGDTLH